MDTINEQCETMALTWFNHPEWWFSKNHEYDVVITEQFEHLLEYEIYSKNVQNKDNLINQVLIWDQLPRHVFRNTQSNHIITYYLHKAIALLQSVPYAMEYASSDAEFMFLMLPFRHTQNMNYIIDVMKASWKWQWKDVDMMRKFMRATYMNAQVNAPVNAQVNAQYPRLHTFQPQPHWKFRTEVHSEVLDTNKYDVTCQVQFPDLRLPDTDFKGSYIVSLSGGVDSMVLLHQLSNVVKIKKSRISCVYIDYDNKPTSPMETAFVIDWCRHIGVPLYVRVISEIHRAPCMDADLREVYETYTKRVRFATYKAVHEIINYHVLHIHPHPTVLLGHNNDDCFENILTNMTSRAKYENLKGMSPVSFQDSICFLRPMLDIPKHTIIAYARKNNIPFLCDSTPAWSQRGKIRDTIVPALQKWNSECIGGFLDMSEVMTALYSCMETHVATCIQNMQITYIDDVKTVHSLSLQPNMNVTNRIFWKMFLVQAFKQVVSHKSLTNFIERITNANNSVRIHIVLNKCVQVYIKQHVFTFHVSKKDMISF